MTGGWWLDHRLRVAPAPYRSKSHGIAPYAYDYRGTEGYPVMAAESRANAARQPYLMLVRREHDWQVFHAINDRALQRLQRRVARAAQVGYTRQHGAERDACLQASQRRAET